ncbi:MAG TPA: hypothetical protein VG826_05880 [Pirellulales bacterium]|nr:hypothetical protein [Pirellulales bacterium]
MFALRLDRWLDYLTGPQLLLGIVWLGMVCVTLTLLLMMVTRWGQSQPLKKCVILSLLTHALLATYATTVEIVGASPREPFVRASIVVTDPSAGKESTDEPGANSAKPWDTFAAAPPPQERTELERPETTSTAQPLDEEQPVSAVLPTELPAMPATELMPPQPASLADIEPAGPQEAAAEEPIEAPSAGRRETRDPALTRHAGPAKTETAKTDGPPALSAASPGLPGELSNVPTLPRMVDLAANRPGPVSPDLPLEPESRGDTALEAESLADSGPRQASDEPRRQTGVGSIVNREARRATDIASMSPANPRPDLIANPLLAPRKPGGADEPAELPRVYENRRAPHKAEIVAAQGGSPATEAAVKTALQWLAANQDGDGRWDASRFGAGQDRAVPGKNLRMVGVDSDNGVTGLALLAFLGNGHTHLDGEHRESVERGLQFLLSTQKPDGNLSGAADDFAAMYCHGMAALAVSEAYAMTQDERLLDPVRKAISYTLASQHPTAGGWRYRPGDPVCDTSQLGWQLMALKSAELAGIGVPDRSRQGMLRFLKSVSSGRHGGLASYRPMSLRGERVTASMTAEALVCRQFLGLQRSDPACDEAGNYIAADLPGRGPNNFYYWYYATLGMFQLQGPHWERWKNALEPTLIAAQRTEGPLSGSWDPDPLWGGHGGRVYSTALGALCLEVYYRFLPLYVQATEAGK